MTNWWDKASTAERLAQIDGGIALGMTSAQIAMASGTTRFVITSTASQNGRSLGLHKPSHGRNRHHDRNRDRSAYLRGDSIDLWGTADHRDEFELDEVV